MGFKLAWITLQNEMIKRIVPLRSDWYYLNTLYKKTQLKANCEQQMIMYVKMTS